MPSIPGNGCKSVSYIHKNKRKLGNCTYQFEEEFATIEVSLVQCFKGALASLLSLEFYDTAAFAASVLILEDVDADDITSLTHVVLEVFPVCVPVEVGEEDAPAFHGLLVVKQVVLVEHG